MPNKRPFKPMHILGRYHTSTYAHPWTISHVQFARRAVERATPTVLTSSGIFVHDFDIDAGSEKQASFPTILVCRFAQRRNKNFQTFYSDSIRAD